MKVLENVVNTHVLYIQLFSEIFNKRLLVRVKGSLNQFIYDMKLKKKRPHAQSEDEPKGQVLQVHSGTATTTTSLFFIVP